MDELGNLISEHTENKGATGTTLIIGLVCLGMSVGMFFLFNGEKEISFNKVLFGLSGVFMIIAGISCIWSYFKNRGAVVKIYENGLTVEKGGKKHLAGWDEIVVVKESVEKIYVNGNYIYDRYGYNIEKTDGENFALSNLISDIERIGRVIKEKTLERLYPNSIAKINNGEQVAFDSLTLDKNGCGGVPWARLANFNIKDGMIAVKDKSGKSVITGAYGATPNAHLLIALLKDYLPFEQ